MGRFDLLEINYEKNMASVVSSKFKKSLKIPKGQSETIY
jgi:hypothetical protein